MAPSPVVVGVQSRVRVCVDFLAFRAVWPGLMFSGKVHARSAAPLAAGQVAAEGYPTLLNSAARRRVTVKLPRTSASAVAVMCQVSLQFVTVTALVLTLLNAAPS